MNYLSKKQQLAAKKYKAISKQYGVLGLIVGFLGGFVIGIIVGGYVHKFI
jgi:hypothetical protein